MMPNTGSEYRGRVPGSYRANSLKKSVAFELSSTRVAPQVSIPFDESSGCFLSAAGVNYELNSRPETPPIGTSKGTFLPVTSKGFDVHSPQMTPPALVNYETGNSAFLPPSNMSIQPMTPPTSMNFSGSSSSFIMPSSAVSMELTASTFMPPSSLAYNLPAQFQPFCANSKLVDSLPGTPEPILSPPGFKRMFPRSLALEMKGPGAYRQYSLSPITVEMEKFFSYPTMSITFMPCVCVPDYPVEEGKPRKICRRCSIAPSSDSGSSTVAIDNKIEQAMDLVKSHLMFAVREEVEVLKEQIAELIERNNQLEYENGILRAAASPETLAKLAQPRQQPPPSSSS